jgi:hypothetical protein
VVVVVVDEVVVDEVEGGEVDVDAVVSASDVVTIADVVALEASAAPLPGSIAEAWLQAVTSRQPPMIQGVTVDARPTRYK